jgi:hypothetical protein
MTVDSNFKANQFYKCDNGSNTALRDRNMHFPAQKEFERISKEYVILNKNKVNELWPWPSYSTLF